MQQALFEVGPGDRLFTRVSVTLRLWPMASFFRPGGDEIDS